MADNSTTAIHCYCKSCILAEAGKLEQKKLFKESFQILQDAVQYYSQITKELEEEKKRLYFRLDPSDQAQFSHSLESPSKNKNGSTGCIAYSHQPPSLVCRKQIPSENSKSNGKFSCPVAIFENKLDPSQKPMYPKHLVYKDGKDIQLEEIRAAMYWERMKKKDAQLSNPEKSKVEKPVDMSLLTDCRKSPLTNRTSSLETVHTPRNIENPLPAKLSENFTIPEQESKNGDKESSSINTIRTPSKKGSQKSLQTESKENFPTTMEKLKNNVCRESSNMNAVCKLFQDKFADNLAVSMQELKNIDKEFSNVVKDRTPAEKEVRKPLQEICSDSLATLVRACENLEEESSNVDTVRTPFKKLIKKPLRDITGENLATIERKSKNADSKLNNTYINDEKPKSVLQKANNFASSLQSFENSKKLNNCSEEDCENQEAAKPDCDKISANLFKRTKVCREPLTKNLLGNENCQSQLMVINRVSEIPQNKTSVPRKETCIEILKTSITGDNIQVDFSTKLEENKLHPTATGKNEQKFTEATFICQPVQKTSITLQRTYIIDGKQETKNSDSKSPNDIKVLDKTPKQLSYLDDISKLLEQSCRLTGNSPVKDIVKEQLESNEDKENILPVKLISPPWVDDEEDITCNTRAFSVVLPSSTPNKRRSQFFSNGAFIVDRPRQSMAGATTLNLSMIPETSRERSSSSSGTGSVASAATSKNFVAPDKPPLSAIAEMEEKSNSFRPKHNVSDPFDSELIDGLLKRLQFPCQRHSSGFHEMNCEMPVMKLSSNYKFGAKKYTIAGEIGKGNYARILKAHPIGRSAELVALKIQKPACVWEYYISKEIQHRLKSEKKCQYFVQYSDIFVFRTGSVLMSEWAPYGSLLNFINSLKTSFRNTEKYPMAVGVHLSLQIVSAVSFLHSCKIIHGDIKPDNFIVSQVSSEGKPYIKLIDFGRSIDMSLFPTSTVFYKIIATEDFTCHEMRDGKPWTYQTDLYGMAGTFYALLVGEYMKTIKRNDGEWVLKKPLARYMNRDQWDLVFSTLLNVPSCEELPDLSHLKEQLQSFYDSFSQFEKKQQFSRILLLFKK